MVVCSASKCTNSSRIKQMRFFKFPNEEKRRMLWMEKCSLENDPGSFAKLCDVHFEESQFELHRQDGWKKLKPNAVPTIFPEPARAESATKQNEKKATRKRNRSSSLDPDEDDVRPKRKVKKRKKNSGNQENSSKKINCKKCGTRSLPEGSQSAQKENVSPRRRKGRPQKLSSPVMDSSSETEIEEDDSGEKAEHEIANLRRENELMRQEIAEFEKHNKAMSRVIMELEKHNKAMAYKLQELDKDNKVMTKKLQDLEKQNEDLRAKLNCCFSEEQFSRMEKLMQLGKIERYIPGIK